MQRLNLQSRRRIGYGLGAIFLVVVVSVLTLPQSIEFHATGPSNIGHEELQCHQCHKGALGTMRQRIQANIQYIFGNRSEAESFGLKPVTNKECIYCHERPNDRHPVYRFFEPKYQKVQQAIEPQYCVSCHREHTGERVTRSMTFCHNCHDELIVKNDSISIRHQELVTKKDWESCLGCHDYHGNHRMTVETEYSNKLSTIEIYKYFDFAESPYSKSKFYQVPKERLGVENEE